MMGENQTHTDRKQRDGLAAIQTGEQTWVRAVRLKEEQKGQHTRTPPTPKDPHTDRKTHRQTEEQPSRRIKKQQKNKLQTNERTPNEQAGKQTIKKRHESKRLDGKRWMLIEHMPGWWILLCFPAQGVANR